MPRHSLPPFLADTWWYGLTQRLSAAQFQTLADLRAAQGFTAVQIVVGIPPEVGPEHPHAASDAGPAWTLRGEINRQYLQLARERITYLNQQGLTAIVYGAWGPQIAWIGVNGMQRWWRAVAETLDDLDVIYCLTGESNLGLADPLRLLPDKSNDDVVKTAITLTRIAGKAPPPLVNLARRAWNKLRAARKQLQPGPDLATLRRERIRQWSAVLDDLRSRTEKPLLLHVIPGETSHDAVTSPEHLAAATVQTGHMASARSRLWQYPLEVRQTYPGVPFVNLEPWYEGIRDQFWAEDQVFAYWASMAGGAAAHSYGAHGIWNAGDGQFLGFWGKQTLAEAMALETPALLGASHRAFLEADGPTLPDVTAKTREGRLHTLIRRGNSGRFIALYPDVNAVRQPLAGRYFLPMQGVYTDHPPERGMLVVFGKDT